MACDDAWNCCVCSTRATLFFLFSGRHHLSKDQMQTQGHENSEIGDDEAKKERKQEDAKETSCESTFLTHKEEQQAPRDLSYPKQSSQKCKED